MNLKEAEVKAELKKQIKKMIEQEHNSLIRKTCLALSNEDVLTYKQEHECFEKIENHLIELVNKM